MIKPKELLNLQSVKTAIAQRQSKLSAIRSAMEGRLPYALAYKNHRELRYKTAFDELRTLQNYKAVYTYLTAKQQANEVDNHLNIQRPKCLTT